MEVIPFIRKKEDVISFTPNRKGTVSLFLRDQVIYEEFLNGDEEAVYYVHPLLKGEKNKDINLRIDAFGSKLTTNLFYIHIPKTGGTSIEQVGYDYGIKWGRFAYDNYHSPSEYFMGLDIVQGKSLFTSIRNPYSRLVSMIYCPYQLINNKLPETRDEFNKLINSYTHTEYPCYDFVYYKDKQVIPHVIKMEDGLNKQFNKLMRKHNCIVKMKIHTNKGVGKKYGVDDIDPANVELINNKFEKDFEHFGYTMK